MEKCNNDLLKLLESILGEGGAIAELALLDALKKDLEERKNPMFTKFAEKAALNDFEKVADQIPESEPKKETEIEKESILSMPKSKTIEERLDAEMERCLTAQDITFLYKVLQDVEHQYLTGEDSYELSPYLKDYATPERLIALNALTEMLKTWVEKQLTPKDVLTDNLETESTCCGNSTGYPQLDEDLKLLPATMQKWTNYLNREDIKIVWLNNCFGMINDDERIGEFCD